MFYTTGWEISAIWLAVNELYFSLIWNTLHVDITVAVATGRRLCLVVETMADSFLEFDDSEIQ